MSTLYHTDGLRKAMQIVTEQLERYYTVCATTQTVPEKLEQKIDKKLIPAISKALTNDCMDGGSHSMKKIESPSGYDCVFFANGSLYGTYADAARGYTARKHLPYKGDFDYKKEVKRLSAMIDDFEKIDAEKFCNKYFNPIVPIGMKDFMKAINKCFDAEHFQTMLVLDDCCYGDFVHQPNINYAIMQYFNSNYTGSCSSDGKGNFVFFDRDLKHLNVSLNFTRTNATKFQCTEICFGYSTTKEGSDVAYRDLLTIAVPKKDGLQLGERYFKEIFQNQFSEVLEFDKKKEKENRISLFQKLKSEKKKETPSKQTEKNTDKKSEKKKENNYER